MGWVCIIWLTETQNIFKTKPTFSVFYIYYIKEGKLDIF